MTSEKRRIFRSFLIAALMTATCVPIPAAEPAVDARQVRMFLEQMRNETGAPGISVAVSSGGRIILSEGVGLAELENRIPATGATVHNIGSVSKTLAVVGIMRLVELGLVKLDDPIRRYAPYFPIKSHPITIEHILTHTSGIRHYKPGEFGKNNLLEKQHFTKLEEAVAHFKDDPLLFEPGTLWSYSSHACNLLQAVIETASGVGFEDFLMLQIWEPAGMLSTSFDVPNRIVHHRGRGYDRDRRGRLRNTRYVDPSYKYAGGGMLSTVEDLCRFGIALNRGGLLKPETTALMLRVRLEKVLEYRKDRDPRPRDFEQALIWRISQLDGHKLVHHGGSVKGTRTQLFIFPDRDMVVALIANSGIDTLPATRALARLFLAKGDAPR